MRDSAAFRCGVPLTDQRFTTSLTRTLVEAVQLRVAELGLPGGGRFAQIVRRAARRGLDVCPLELGRHLRLALLHQPESVSEKPAARGRAPVGSITIASGELSSDDNLPKGFYLRRIRGVLWLRGYRSWADHFWSPEDEFVLVRSRHRA